MKKIYLDANVLLEILFRRDRYRTVMQLLETMPDAQFCMSVLSVDLVMYFVEIEKQPKDRAWKFLQNYEQLDMTAEDVAWAYDNDAGDFEDALQVGCARRHACEEFITLDRSLGSMYGKYLPVRTVR